MGVIGPSGIGKTTLGLHFVCESAAEEPSLFFGFYETPPRLIQVASSLGLDLAGRIGSGEAEIMWQPQGEDIQDAMAHRLLDRVRRHHTRRLFIDGLGAFQEASIEPDRIGRFFSVLVNELRALDVTTLYTMETPDLIGPGMRVPIEVTSAIMESLLGLRYLEHHSRARRLLSVIKVRGSGFDPTLREFSIADGQGICLAGPFEDAEHLLTGFAHDRIVRGVSPAPGSQ